MPVMLPPTALSLRDLSIAAIVLAAGRGERMGTKSKLLLPLRDGRPIIRHAVEGALRFEPLEMVVVVQPDAPQIRQALCDLSVKYVPNPLYLEGMGTSLAAGVASLREDARGVLVLLGDEPAISTHIIHTLVAAYLRERKAVTIPRYGTQFGPPTLFSDEAFPMLRRLRGDTGGRQLAVRHTQMTCVVQFDEQDRPADVDTPEDYKALL